jgi:S-adenosylmethionine:tRNA ribosyltransferase-isomerase
MMEESGKMNLSDFDFIPTGHQVAQYPLQLRDASRLCVVHRRSNEFEHRLFRDIAEYFRGDDLLVLNDTKVFPARLSATKPSGGRAEVLLLRELEGDTWEALVRGKKRGELLLEEGITAHVSPSNGVFRVRFRGKDVRNSLRRIARIALPPYIRRAAEPSDGDRYQTVYADREGSVAAPTAGLHFTDRVISALKEKGVEVRRLSLHIGYGTFRPVRSSDIREHRMDEESYQIPESTADAVNRARERGRRIVAVGTSVTRTLEASAGNNGHSRIEAGAGRTSLFIYPGFRFRVVDALITNFHQPRSTPLMLTSAFSGQELLRRAYVEAAGKGYRFFSYGDAMFIT